MIDTIKLISNHDYAQHATGNAAAVADCDIDDSRIISYQSSIGGHHGSCFASCQTTANHFRGKLFIQCSFARFYLRRSEHSAIQPSAWRHHHVKCELNECMITFQRSLLIHRLFSTTLLLTKYNSRMSISSYFKPVDSGPVISPTATTSTSRKRKEEDSASITTTTYATDDGAVTTETESTRVKKIRTDTDTDGATSARVQPALVTPPAAVDAQTLGDSWPLHLESLIPAGWHAALAREFTQPYFKTLKSKLAEAVKKPTPVFPPPNLIFRALSTLTPATVKVVIIGQDPYHGAGQAEGLCFSVPKNVPLPPSLNNIYKELTNDIPGFTKPTHGHLAKWAEQGILLLNTTLTVQRAEANSHSKYGWEQFTDAIIIALNKSSSAHGIVYILWGNHAQKKGLKIDGGKHHILKGAHPSPLSASKFFGCKHFSKCNELLIKDGKTPIEWQL